MLGKTEGGRRRGHWRMRWLDGNTDSMNMSLSRRWTGDGDGQGSLVCCSSWGGKESDMTEQLTNNKAGKKQTNKQTKKPAAAVLGNV